MMKLKQAMKSRCRMYLLLDLLLVKFHLSA